MCLLSGFRPRFHSVLSHPLCNCLVKKINQGTDVFTHKHTELPASSLSIMCSEARMYEINYIDRQWKQSQDKTSWKWPVGNRHPPLRLQIYFIISDKCLPALTAHMGREGVCEKVGSKVKWASGYHWYYIHYVNQYAVDFQHLLLFWFPLFYTLKFLIHYFQNLSTLCIFFSLPIHHQENQKNWSIQCKSVGLPTKCSIELLVCNKIEHKYWKCEDVINHLW